MKRIIYILLLAMGMGTVVPMVSLVDNNIAAVYAADAKAKAKAQREKEKAKKQKEREKAKAKAQKEREKAAAQKKKEQAKAASDKKKAQQQKQKQQAAATAAKAKAKPAANQAAKPAAQKPMAAKTDDQLTAAQEKEAYMNQVAAIDKANAKANAYNNRPIEHRLGFWGEVGYSNLYTSDIQYTPGSATTNSTGFINKDKGFVGGGIGLGYELKYRRFVMTTGVEFTLYNSLMGVVNQKDGSMLLSYGMQPYADKMTYNYSFSPLNDKLISGFAQIPLLFGMEWDQVPLFWLVGAKVG